MSDPIPFANCFTEAGDAPSPWVFLGIADDTQSTYLGGCCQAPETIRRAYDGRCFNATSESGVDLEAAVADAGDLKPRASWAASAALYRSRVEELLGDGKTPFIAGGDHAITVPAVEAFGCLDRPIHIVQIDAHPDLYPDFEGNPASHACTGARVLEMAHVASLTQLGIRTMNAVQRAVRDHYADRLHVYEAALLRNGLPRLEHVPEGACVYLTVDMDGLDPAFAPGVSHPVPGGLDSRVVLDFVRDGHWTLVGMDVVEVNPARDVGDQTAILAGRLLHEGMGYAAKGTRQHD